MKFENFVEYTDLVGKPEIDRAKMVLFHSTSSFGISEMSVSEIVRKLEQNGFSKINKSRLENNIKKSKDFAIGSKKGLYKLTLKSLRSLKTEYPLVKKRSEEVIAEESILPNSLFQPSRGFIEKICIQINGTYNHNYFDACAVLMRRLIEILLILTYQDHKKENEIQESTNDYKGLNFIINYTRSNNQFHFSKGTLEMLDVFRKLGNFSAHGIHYNCKLKDIDNVKIEYRVAVEELLYKSGIK